jgi:hypothetical protein
MTENTLPDSLDLRNELQELVREELLGPAGGPEEIIREVPTSRYLLGLLAPRNQSRLETLEEEEEELAIDSGETSEEGTPDAPIPIGTSLLPSSLGLTFSVDPDADSFQVHVSYGVYQRLQPGTEIENEDGEVAVLEYRAWRRQHVEADSPPFRLLEGLTDIWNPDPENENIVVRGLVRDHEDGWAVTLYLINYQEEPSELKEEAWLFQPALEVYTPNNASIFLKREIPLPHSQEDIEDLRMRMLYRKELEFAVGHGVAVHASLADGRWDRAVRLSTQIMPTCEVEQMEAPSPEDIPALENVTLDMRVLSETDQGEFWEKLSPLADAYENWIEENRSRLTPENIPPDLARFDQIPQNTLDDCQSALKRIRQGIRLLDQEQDAAKAFQFANRAMADQRVRTVYTRTLRQGAEITVDEVDIPQNRSWRPFQLAFVLLNLAALHDPTHPERSDRGNALADLLWFPTGGGKTEAYLGVAAFAMGIRRLQRNEDWLDGQAGVTVLMRYTLRLLTLQQFQRASTLICACEVIRREDPQTWGEEPFRIGLWVGMRSTPNYTDQADEVIRQDRGQYTGGQGAVGTPAQLPNCPWCGKPIRPGVDIVVEKYGSGRGRTFQYCSDTLGQCPFSQRQSRDEGVPIIVVDEEVYRRLPTLLIATVDKFAQMPWKGAAQMLFGRVSGKCPRHGFRSPEIEDADRHNRRAGLQAVQTIPYTQRLRPPDLIIQDELHLISGPLGTLVGLYETAVDALCSWEIDGQKIYPKVIASTATIRRAREQVYKLFLREVKIFPPPGLDVEDNFFSRKVNTSIESPGRLYLGVCAPGKRLKTALIRVYAAFMAASQLLFEEYGRLADPWMTLVGYFNSMRELGGMRRVVDDTLRTRLTRMQQRGLADRNIYPYSVDELTSRKGGRDIPKVLDQLEAVFDPNLAEERRRRKRAGEAVSPTEYPLDIVLATNMISVGVDVGRLGLMAVASQPKTTAEYIQATSRVGRRFPGIVCTVYNWTRPRDLSHYERFEHYHATFYEQVEALSVTPFSPRALDRGLSGVFTSLIRLWEEILNPNVAAGHFTPEIPYYETVRQELIDRAEMVTEDPAIVDMLTDMIAVREQHWRYQSQREGSSLSYSEESGTFLPLLKKPQEEPNDLFTCLNSLRDVEPSVGLVFNDYGMDRLMSTAASSNTTNDEENGNDN